MAAEHVARKLVEQDDGRERGQRIGQEGSDRLLALLEPDLQETLLDSLVEHIAAAPPLLRSRPNQNFSTSARQSAPFQPAQRHAAVPPTVNPSTSSVG